MSNHKDLMQEINRAIADILEAILRAMFEKVKEEQRLEQEFLTQVYRQLGKEMGNQLTQQLREQLKEVKVSALELPEKSGQSKSLYLVHDRNGKAYNLGNLDKNGQMELIPKDGKGEVIKLNPGELGFSPKVERSLLATSTLAVQEQKVWQVLQQSITQSRADGKPILIHFHQAIKEQLQQEMVQKQLNNLELTKNTYRGVEYRKIGVEHELEGTKAQLKLPGIPEELKTELKAKQKGLENQLEGYQKWLEQNDHQLDKGLQMHCPQLSDHDLKKLSFEERTSLAQTAFPHTSHLTNEQLRGELKKQGNEKGLEALDKVEGRDRTEDRGDEMIEELKITEIKTEMK